MRGASRAAFGEARDALARIAGDADVAATVAGELFAVTGLLDREPVLRRVLTDSTRPREARTELVRQLLGDRVSPDTLGLLTGMAGARWSASRDLADAAGELAVLATAAAAAGEGQLDDVEDQLFRFGRILGAEPDLHAALASPRLPDDRKLELLETLLGDRVTPASLRLITQAVGYPRGRSLEANLAEYSRLVAAWRQRLIATVRVAVELSGGQRERLAETLSAIYGQGIQLNIVIDPAVIGGMSVQIGDDLIDGTLSSRLAELRRRLAA